MVFLLWILSILINRTGAWQRAPDISMHVKEIESAIVAELQGLDLSEWDLLEEISTLIEQHQTDKMNMPEAFDELTHLIKSSQLLSTFEDAIIGRLSDMIQYNE